jgi:hypothetical protein
MGKITKRVILIASVIVSLAFFINLFKGEYNSAYFKIFKAETNGYVMQKMLGFVPDDFKNSYNEKILRSSSTAEVVSITSKSSSVPTNYILLRQGHNEVFIKAYPLELHNRNTITGSKQHFEIAQLIDVKSFNAYLRDFEVTHKNQAIQDYCYFLSLPENSENYYMIQQLADLDTIIHNKPITNTETLSNVGYEIIDPAKLEFEESDKSTYCWFQKYGLIKFEFEFKGECLVQVKSTSLGYLGNEFPYCC